MKKLFIESSGFTKRVVESLADHVYADLQNQLMENPESGDVIPGSGGLRKVRVPDPKRRKGKRGGARAVYLHVPEVDWIFLIDLYDKGEKEDLSPGEKKILKGL